MGRLRTPKIKNAFVLKLKNRFQALTSLEDEDVHTQLEERAVNNMWEHIKTTYSETGKACLGTTKQKRKDWITPDTWQAIENRRELKKKVLEAKSERLQERYKGQYRETDRKVKRMVRADKRAYMEDLVKQAEDAAKRGEQGTLYRISNTICGRYRRNTSIPITNQQGRLLTSESEIET